MTDTEAVTLDEIKESLDYAGDHSLADLVAALKGGRAKSFSAPRAFIAVSVINMSGRTVLAYWVAAGDLEPLKGLSREVEGWARAQGCVAAQLGGRPGWKRTLKDMGWKPKYVTLEKEL